VPRTIDDAAALMHISRSTAKRYWAFAPILFGTTFFAFDYRFLSGLARAQLVISAAD
jgi:hypothetical protein